MASESTSTKRITTLGILSALGTVLMLIEIPYPLVPFLTIDLSDVVVLIVFLLYGWKEAAFVGLLKAVAHMLFKGAVGPLAIGQLTAFLASMSYVLGMYISTNRLNQNRYVSAIVTVLLVTLIMTVGNYLFITPIWFGQTTYLDVQSWVTPDAFGLTASGGYLTTILLVYVPFNLIKGTVIMVVYFIVSEIVKVYLDK